MNDPIIRVYIMIIGALIFFGLLTYYLNRGSK